MRFLAILILLPFIGFCQENEGSPFTKKKNQTFAVVAGISNYQDENIKDLKYADKDAEAFALYLQSPAGGSLDKDHIKVLLNESSTQAKLDAALWWLVDEAKEGDEVIIYFSGHGDVERKSVIQPGFLLCWDAQSHGYTGGGAYPLTFLNLIISTLSTENKANVKMIADACRSGKLAGETIGGTQATAQYLSKQFANEVKILSCQPDEFSLEGKQWGGGRGAFSYHLIKGLIGLADVNQDKIVSLLEIERYLQDNVTKEVDPAKQNPITTGNKTAFISNVESKSLEDLLNNQNDNLNSFASTEGRGIEDEILATLDSKTRKKYKAFYKAIEMKSFLFPKNACADYYYEILIKESKLQRLHASMKRNYAAALQDEAQQVMNSWMKSDLSQFITIGVSNKKSLLPKENFDQNVETFPLYLEKAAKILGPSHYMYDVLLSRKHFFNGYLIANANLYASKSVGNQALKEFKKAIQLQGELSQAHWQMSRVYGIILENQDSMEYYGNMVIDKYPNWILPYTDMAFMLSNKYKDFDKAKVYLDAANKISANSLSLLNTWGVYYYSKGDFDKAELKFKEVLNLNPTSASAYTNLGNIYLKQKRYDLAEQHYKTAIQYDATSGSYNNLGILYFYKNEYEDAKVQYKKAIEIDANYLDAHFNLGVIYDNLNEKYEAEIQYSKALEIDPNFSSALLNIGILYISQTKYTEAEKKLLLANKYDPISHVAKNALGIVSEQLNYVDKAQEYYHESIKLNPDFSTAYSNLGSLLLKLKNYKEAKNNLLKAIELNPNDVTAYNNLGLIHKYDKQFESAEEYFDKAIALDKKYVNGYINKGVIYFEQNNLDAAEIQFLKVIQLDNTNEQAYNNLGTIYKSLGKYEDAKTYFEKAIETGAEKWQTYMNLGIVYQILNKWQESETMLNKALQKNNKKADLYALLGNALIHNSKDGENSFKKAIIIDPNWADTYIYYAILKVKQSKISEAWQYFEQGLKLGIGKGDISPNDLQENEDFEVLREDPKWDILMNAYFKKE
jgi:tetratricopeptide (TPR) repeat protein/uncharacterized caspase-like protein